MITIDPIDFALDEGESGAVRPADPPLRIRFKARWADEEWFEVDGVRVDRIAWQTSAAGGEELVISRTYAPQVVEDGQTRTVPPLDLDALWVRIEQDLPPEPLDDGGEGAGGEPTTRILFQGVVESPRDELGGDRVQTLAGQLQRMGRQVWVSLGGRRLLERAQIGQTFWSKPDLAPATGSIVVALDWRPTLNAVHGRIELGPNRSQADLPALDDSDDPPRRLFHFNADPATGGTWWTAGQFVEHMLWYYLQRGVSGPRWTLTGQVELLAETFSPGQAPWRPRLDLADTESVRKVLDELIATERGMHYLVRPVEEGFELEVQALLPDDPAFTAQGFPTSSWKVDYNVTQRAGESCTIETGRSARADKLVVRGARITLTMTVGPGGSDAAPLTNGWSIGRELVYRAGAGTPAEGTPAYDPALHDAARTRDKLRDVFSRFIVDPATFFYDGGALNIVLGEGSQQPGDPLEGDAFAFQMTEVGTLEKTPLIDGVDYSAGPPGEFPAPGDTRSRRPLMVLVKGAIAADTDAWAAIERLTEVSGGLLPSASCEALDDAIGVRIHANPPHILAKSHWTSANPSANFPDPDVDGLDWESDLLVTLTFETDHRIQVTIPLPAELQAGDGTVRVIDVGLAQLDLLAPNTVVDLDALGGLVRSPDSLLTINDDRALLIRLAAGATARYLTTRTRIALTRYGLDAWDTRLGALLEAKGADGPLSLPAPVTSVALEYERGHERVTILAGQAGT